MIQMRLSPPLPAGFLAEETVVRGGCGGCVSMMSALGELVDLGEKSLRLLERTQARPPGRRCVR